jgi:hypothetical protein
VVLVAVGFRVYGWAGWRPWCGGMVMWALLHFTRLMNVLRKRGQPAHGHVGSAVMLNAKLKPGMTLMHVVAMTRRWASCSRQGRAARGLPLDRRHPNRM